MVKWIISSLALGIAIGYFLNKWQVKHEINQQNEQLKKIAALQLSETQLSVTNVGSALTPLVAEINKVLDVQRSIIRKQNYSEKQLLEDMANISHDLRTPLTAIYGYLELLKNKNLSEAQRQHYLDIILERTDLLQNLIQDLFYLTKLQTYSLAFETTHFSLSNTLKETLVSYFKPFSESDIHLEVAIDDYILLESDLNAVERIFTNLIENMYVHGHEQAQIKLYTHPSGQIIAHFKNKMETATSDNLDIEQIFSRHYMANISREQANSGLGLTICKELSEQLGFELLGKVVDNCFIIELIFSSGYEANF